jgi:NAD(P)H-hydrate epimerase
MNSKIFKEMLSMPARPADAYKASVGRVLVVGGSRGISGAAALTAEASLRIGAGVVTLACPATLQDIYAIKLTSVMTVGVADTGQGHMDEDALPELVKRAQNCDVVAIGPGLGRDPSTQRVVLKLVAEVQKLMVIDADGLYALGGDLSVLDRRAPETTILTPHLGEMSCLGGCTIGDLQERRNEIGIAFAKKHRCILVVKGPGTLVTDGPHAYENTSGGPELATAGSGDVLTGLIAGLAAQGSSPLKAAMLGVHLHGLCGRFGAERWTKFGLISSDLIRFLPEAIRSLEREVQ